MSSHTESPRRIGNQPCSASKTRNLALLRTSPQERRRQVTVRAARGGVPVRARRDAGDPLGGCVLACCGPGYGQSPATGRRRQVQGRQEFSGSGRAPVALWLTPGETPAPSGATLEGERLGVGWRSPGGAWPPSGRLPVPPWRRAGEFDLRSRSGQCLAAPRRRPGLVPVLFRSRQVNRGPVLAASWPLPGSP